MKFTQHTAFEKHMKEAYPAHLSAVYVVICPKEQERKANIEGLESLLGQDRDSKRCVEAKDVILHLSGGSLLSAKLLAVLDPVQVYDQAVLASYIASPNPEGVLLMGAENTKVVNELYKKGKKEMVILDLSQEKPWESKQRVEQWLIQKVAANGKQITPAAASLLGTRGAGDRLLLEQEVEKLLCHAGQNKTITEEDVHSMCCDASEANLFSLAQSIVWGLDHRQLPSDDLGTLLPLIGMMRAQLEMGLKMRALLQQEKNRDAIAQAFPKLWPKAFEQCLSKVREKELAYFSDRLQALFHLELGLKTSRSKPGGLFAQFLCFATE